MKNDLTMEDLCQQQTGELFKIEYLLGLAWKPKWPDLNVLHFEPGALKALSGLLQIQRIRDLNRYLGRRQISNVVDCIQMKKLKASISINIIFIKFLRRGQLG